VINITNRNAQIAVTSPLVLSTRRRGFSWTTGPESTISWRPSHHSKPSSDTPFAITRLELPHVAAEVIAASSGAAIMKRIINGFEVDWASERVFAEQQTAPNYGYLFEVSANRKRIVRCAHSSAIGGDSDKAMPAHLFSYPTRALIWGLITRNADLAIHMSGPTTETIMLPLMRIPTFPPTELLRSLVPELLRLQQHLLPLSPLFTLSLKRLTEVYLGPTGWRHRQVEVIVRWFGVGLRHQGDVTLPRTFEGVFKSSVGCWVRQPQPFFGRTLIIEFKAAAGEALAISIPRAEAPAIRYLCRMGWSCPTFHEVKRAPASLPGLQVRSIVRPRDCSPRRSDFYPKAQSHKWLSKKCRSVSKRCRSKQSFSFVLLLKQETNVRRKESSHEKVRSMPWKAGIGRPLP